MKRSGMMAFVLGLGCASASALAVPMVSFTLVPLDPINTPGEFRVDVNFDDGDAPSGSGLTFLQLDVGASSGNITDNGNDFSRFTFTSALPAGWNEFPADGFGLGDSVVSYDVFPPDSALAALTEGLHTIGFLSVNLSGLTAGDNVTIALAPADFFFGTTAGLELVPGFEPGPQDDFNFFLVAELDGVISVEGGVHRITVPGDQPPIDVTVPEPATAALGAMALMGLGLRRRRLA